MTTEEIYKLTGGTHEMPRVELKTGDGQTFRAWWSDEMQKKIEQHPALAKYRMEHHENPPPPGEDG